MLCVRTANFSPSWSSSLCVFLSTLEHQITCRWGKCITCHIYWEYPSKAPSQPLEMRLSFIIKSFNQSFIHSLIFGSCVKCAHLPASLSCRDFTSMGSFPRVSSTFPPSIREFELPSSAASIQYRSRVKPRLCMNAPFTSPLLFSTTCSTQGLFVVQMSVNAISSNLRTPAPHILRDTVSHLLPHCNGHSIDPVQASKTVCT